MFKYKKLYRAQVEETESLKQIIEGYRASIAKLKKSHDALLGENDTLTKMLESCKKREEAALTKAAALEGEVAALEEEVSRAKRDFTVANESLGSTSKKLDELQAELADLIAHEGDCEGCYYKATKNYRKCNSCTRNTKAVDKYISAAEFETATETVIAEVPTPEEAVSAEDVAELHEGSAVIPSADVQEPSEKPLASEPVEEGTEPVPAESVQVEEPKAPVKKSKKKNRKKTKKAE